MSFQERALNTQGLPELHLVVLGAVLVGTLGAATGASAAEPGVAFLEDGDIAVSLEPGETETRDVWIVNGGPTSAILSLIVISKSAPDGAPTLALTDAPDPNGRLATSGRPVAPGATWVPVLTMSGDAPMGSYRGRLVVVSSDGSHAARDVAVSVAGDEASAAPPGDVFREPIPDPLTARAERGLLAWFDGGRFAASVELRLDPRVSASIGPLIDDRGRITVAALGPDGVLSVAAAPGAGTFKGTISKAGIDGAPTKLASLNLAVRDHWAWALATLVLGLLLAYLVDRWFTKQAPRRALEARIAELREQSTQLADQSAEELRAVRLWFGPDRKPVLLWQECPPAGVLAGLVTQALADFDETPTPARRDERWGTHGTELAKARGYLETQAELEGLRLSTNRSYADAITALGPRAGQYEETPLARTARGSLAGGLISTIPDLRRIAEERRDVTTRVEKAGDLARILARLDTKVPQDGPLRVRQEALWRRFTDLRDGSLEELRTIANDARALWDAVAGAGAAELAAEEDMYRPDSMAAALSSFYGADTGGGYGDAADLERTSVELRTSLARGNLLFMGVTAALVIAAGFGTQYFSNAVFGSEADYTALLVWSFSAAAAAQVLKYAASTARVGRSSGGQDGSGYGDIAL